MRRWQSRGLRRVESEKRRKIAEYQQPYVEWLLHCLHCQHDLTSEELCQSLYRDLGRICTTCRAELAQYLEPEEDL